SSKLAQCGLDVGGKLLLYQRAAVDLAHSARAIDEEHAWNRIDGVLLDDGSVVDEARIRDAAAAHELGNVRGVDGAVTFSVDAQHRERLAAEAPLHPLEHRHLLH